MDANKIFRQLTSGISFDKKKYRNDAQLFGLTKGQLPDNCITDENNYLLIDDNHSNGNASDESESNSTPDSVENDEDDDFKLLSNEIKLTKTKAPKKKKKSNQQKLLLHQEKINQFRNIHKIHVNGSDIPDPIDSWDKLLSEKYGMSEKILEVVTSKENGYSSPTPIQMQAIPLLLGKIKVFQNT